MNFPVGFTAYKGLSETELNAVRRTHERALAKFDHFVRKSLKIGDTHLELWGRKGMDKATCTLPDGSILALIGSPHAAVELDELRESVVSSEFQIPWDGRVILLRISPDGKHWTMWNDWLGSIPVFHARIGQGRLASTLEPVVVAGAGYTADDFHLPGLVSLLINGHFISNWTMYKGMKTVPPDSMSEWDEKGFRAKQLWTVQPSQSRWEAGWDDLVDEMYELSRRAIADALKTHPAWILPLSSGLDSRLIAGVGAEIGANMRAYAWGEPKTTDVVYSREVAQALNLPWKHIEIRNDFLAKYTKEWADWFGSGLHFHGMYMMSFLDALDGEPDGPVISGFVGDTLAGDIISELVHVHANLESHQVGSEWYVFWTAEELRSLFRTSVEEALQANADEIRKLITLTPGTRFQQLQFLELWGRQRLFIPYQSTLCDYWRGVGTPFMNREYARFCLSLPRPVLDDRRLLFDVFRRYYGKLAVIPGTYANEPLILTGRYLVKRRGAKILPEPLQMGPFAGFSLAPLRMDMTSIRFTGRDALWPLFETKADLDTYLDMEQLESAYRSVLQTLDDIRPLRKLQVVQTLAYRLSQASRGD